MANALPHHCYLETDAIEADGRSEVDQPDRKEEARLELYQEHSSDLAPH